MEELIYFGITFLIIYTIYYFASIRKAKKNKDRLPVEVQYLILRYNIDVNKISYRSFLNTIAIVGGIDVALVVTIISQFDEFIWQVLFGFVFIIPIIVISFMFVGKYYQRQQNIIMSENKNIKKDGKKKGK